MQDRRNSSVLAIAIVSLFPDINDLRMGHWVTKGPSLAVRHCQNIWFIACSTQSYCLSQCWLKHNYNYTYQQRCFPLQWRHKGRDGVSHHQPHDCLLNCLFRCRSKKHQIPASLAFVRGIHQWPVNSPHKGSVTRKMFPFDDVIMSTGVAKPPSPLKLFWTVKYANSQYPNFV